MTLYPAKTKSVLLLVICGGAAAFGTYLTTSGELIGVPIALIFGAGFLGVALQLAGHGSRLVIGPDSFTIGSFGAHETYAWRDVVSVSTVTTTHQPESVAFKMRDGVHSQLDDDYGVGVRQLAIIFEQRRANAAGERK